MANQQNTKPTRGKATGLHLTLSTVRTVQKPKLVSATASQASMTCDMSTSIPESLTVAPSHTGTGGRAKKHLNPEAKDNGQACSKKAKTTKVQAAKDEEVEQDKLEETADEDCPNPRVTSLPWNASEIFISQTFCNLHHCVLLITSIPMIPTS
ncbi:hypothetical protein FRC06_002359, partial [Ceratobasidium sp. 370]